MNWSRGYYAETGYTHGYYPETSPPRISWVATLAGIRAPSKKFRYLDLGCGQGLGLIHDAAMNPDSDFLGIDFMPEHIAHGRKLAAEVGVSNVEFIEADFIDIEKQPWPFGEFDYVIAHGISTWVSADVRRAMFSLASRALKPGGLMFNSYNTSPGWLPTVPFQNLVSQLQRRHGSLKAIEVARELMQKIKVSGAGYFDFFPSFSRRLEEILNSDSRYLSQEYGNSWWNPTFSNEMLTEAASHKLSFISSATLPEVFDSCYPEAVSKLVEQETDTLLKESLRDLCLMQSFRRDIYVKGGVDITKVDQMNSILDHAFIKLNLIGEPKSDGCFEFSAGTMRRQGKFSMYGPILNQFSNEGQSLRNVLTNLKGLSAEALIQGVTLLVHGGWLGFKIDQEVDFSRAIALNNLAASSYSRGYSNRYLIFPRAQTSMRVSELDMLCVALFNGNDIEVDRAMALLASMKSRDIQFMSDGKPIMNREQNTVMATKYIGEFERVQLKNFKRLGAVSESA